MGAGVQAVARSHVKGLELAIARIVMRRVLRYMKYENLQYKEKFNGL
jgi:hypothetical protein